MSEENACTPERMIEGFNSMSDEDKAKVRAHIMGFDFQGCDASAMCREMMEKFCHGDSSSKMGGAGCCGPSSS
jgi:hypothetical protein